MKVYLNDVLAWFPEGTWICVSCDTVTDRSIFGKTGGNATQELSDAVTRIYKRNPEVYEISHLDGFKHGIALRVR